MDSETAKYIINYFSNLLTSAERMAIKHTTSTYKLEHSTSDNTNLTRIYREKGWLTSDQSVLDLLKDGYDNFELNVANRIINHHPDKVFFNTVQSVIDLQGHPMQDNADTVDIVGTTYNCLCLCCCFTCSS